MGSSVARHSEDSIITIGQACGFCLFQSRYQHLSLPPRTRLALPLPPSTTTCGSIARNEECGTTARHVSKVMRPMCSISLKTMWAQIRFSETRILPNLSSYDFDRQCPDSTEGHDEHLRSENASPLLTQRREKQRQTRPRLVFQMKVCCEVHRWFQQERGSPVLY